MATQRFSLNQPKEMYLLALTEMCQRFAFWGIANLLVLFLVQNHHFTDQRADTLFGLFTGIAFVLPMLGGYIADRLGYKLPVFYGCLLTAIGCFLIATGMLSLIYVALILVVIGGAMFTPSIYALLGIIYKNKHHAREGGFSIYYSSVNIGVFLAMVILGYIGQAKYWNLAFFIAGCIQLVGLIPFRMVLQSPILSNPTASSTNTIPTSKGVSSLHKHERDRIWVIVILSLFSIVFWMAYNQGGSSMNLFALRYTERRILDFNIPPSWFLSLESLYLVLFAFPLAALYGFLVRKKKDPSPPMKCALSLLAIGLCFTIMVIGSMKIPPYATGASLSPFYLIFAYALMALGEMLICPIGLSLITHLSPHRYTAFLVGIWYFCIGVAFYLGGILAGTTFIPAIILLLLSKKLDQMRRLNSL
jgi:proton-dependent oligopeptide transporter, POT family